MATALHFAVRSENLSVVQYLVECNADVNARLTVSKNNEINIHELSLQRMNNHRMDWMLFKPHH